MNNRINTILETIHIRILSCDVKQMEFEDILIGKLGLAYTSYLLYKTHNNEQYLNKVQEVLEDIFETTSNGTSTFMENPSLANGIPGLGLVMYQLMKEGVLDNSFNEQLDIINETIYTKCINTFSKGNFDYFYGATGLLFYLNEVNTKEKVEHLVNIFYQYGIDNNFLFYNQVNDVYSQGINFGFAHGTLAIIAVFLEIYKKGIQVEKTKELILKTTDELLKFKKDKINREAVNIMHETFDYPSYFPYNVIGKNTNSIDPVLTNNIFHFTERLGWCNSDLSRMYVLYKIGIEFNEQHYVNEANDMIGELVARKEEKDTAISDCYMCHGTSGVAHLYKKIYELTKEPIFHKVYEYWIGETIHFMDKELLKEPSDKDLEMLTGWLGPLFVLSDYKGQSYKEWDRIFLLN